MRPAEISAKISMTETMRIVHIHTRHAAVALFLCANLAAALKQPVPTERGLVTGVPGTDKSITVFKGIPFAAAPTGSRRWRGPRPPAKWQGVRVADHFGPGCIQTIV